MHQCRYLELHTQTWDLENEEERIDADHIFTGALSISHTPPSPFPSLFSFCFLSPSSPPSLYPSLPLSLSSPSHSPYSRTQRQTKHTCVRFLSILNSRYQYKYKHFLHTFGRQVEYQEGRVMLLTDLFFFDRQGEYRRVALCHGISTRRASLCSSLANLSAGAATAPMVLYIYIYCIFFQLFYLYKSAGAATAPMVLFYLSIYDDNRVCVRVCVCTSQCRRVLIKSFPKP